MKLGIMQPYFFPYIGYYSLIKHTDKFILLDSVQFIRHGWIERNRILKPNEGWQYISVPLQKHSRDTLIQDIRIRISDDWRNKITRQLEHYKKAPFYYETLEVVGEALSVQSDSITKLNEHILKVTCKYLSLPTTIDIFSEMNLDIELPFHPGDWALNISKKLKAEEYTNSFGGYELFESEKFKKENIQLSFLKNHLYSYTQKGKGFEPGLSIIDLMMFNSKNEISSMLNDFELIFA